MSKRIRNSAYNGQRSYRKRRRYNSLSPARGNEIEMENAKRITELLIEIQILQAQITILRKELHDLRETQQSGQLHHLHNGQHTGKEDKSRICLIM